MTTIRFAADSDLDLLADIENAADRRFVERFLPDRWDAAPSGRERAAQPGFLLVAEDDGELVGFAQVLEIEGAHLEQVSVDPASGRRGIGRALVRESIDEAGRRGHRRVTLRTYADVPWNAPFYARLGFVEAAPDTGFLVGLVEVERRARLDRWGRRVQMTASIGVVGER